MAKRKVRAKKVENAEAEIKKTPKPAAPKIGMWQMIAVLLGILLVASVGMSAMQSCPAPAETDDETQNDTETGSSMAAVVGGSMDFINEYLLGGEMAAVLEDSSESNGLYVLDVSVEGQLSTLYVSSDGKLIFPMVIDVEEVKSQPPTNDSDVDPLPPLPDSIEPIGYFEGVDAEACTEDGKPLIIMVGSSTCPFCTWSEPQFEEIAQEYEGRIAAYSWQADSGDNLLTEEIETEVPEYVYDLFGQFNPGGGVPTFIFGCKYYRIGQPYRQWDDAEGDMAEMREVIDALIAEAAA
jgi:thiol-disulfide isomerase/thioredoxin